MDNEFVEFIRVNFEKKFDGKLELEMDCNNQYKCNYAKVAWLGYVFAVTDFPKFYSYISEGGVHGEDVVKKKMENIKTYNMEVQEKTTPYSLFSKWLNYF